MYFEFEIRFILTDLNWIFLIKLSELKISFSDESYDEKTAENDQNCYVAKKTHSFQTIKDIDLKF